MADKPVEATVQTVLEGPNNWNDKDIYVVLFADRSEKHSFFVPEGDDPPVEDGLEKGWFGEKKNGEPKFSRASDKAPAQRSSNGSSGAGRDDATGRSIERQVAAKIAGEAIGAPAWEKLGDATYQAEYDARASWLTDVWARAIRAEAS